MTAYNAAYVHFSGYVRALFHYTCTAPSLKNFYVCPCCFIALAVRECIQLSLHTNLQNGSTNSLFFHFQCRLMTSVVQTFILLTVINI